MQVYKRRQKDAEADRGRFHTLAGCTAPRKGKPHGSGSDLYPKSKRHVDDVSRRRTLQSEQ